MKEYTNKFGYHLQIGTEVYFRNCDDHAKIIEIITDEKQVTWLKFEDPEFGQCNADDIIIMTDRSSDEFFDEESDIPFTDESQLSYYDNEDEDGNVLLLINGKPYGRFEVWYDSEMDNREYLTLNYTITYLDTLTRINS